MLEPRHFDFRTRRSNLLAALGTHNAQAMLITDLDNVFFLTGFTGSNGAVALLADGSVTLVTDGRYRDQAQEECRGTEVIIDRAAMRKALHVAAKTPNGRAATNGEIVRDGETRSVRQAEPRVAFEADHLSVSAWRALLEEPDAACLIPTSNLVESLRRSKEPAEVELIESACRIAEAALHRSTADVRAGMSEREIARALNNAMLEGGADGVAFETIVATGPNSAIPHHSPTAREVAAGDLLKIDFGAKLGRYHSDITRTFVVGNGPSNEQIRWHAAVQRAATAARESLGAGVPTAVPYLAARDVLAEEGFGDAFTHGLGHGVGLVIHEAPIMTAESGGRLVAGDVLTVEPGVYFPGVGGVRIEDTLLVTDTGSRCLTTIPRDLVRLD